MSLAADFLVAEPAGAATSGRGAQGQPQSVYKYNFQVGSVDSFERKMEEAQEALGISLGEEVRLLVPPPVIAESADCLRELPVHSIQWLPRSSLLCRV